MSSPDRGRGDSPGVRPEPAATAKTPGMGQADAADPYANWLDRMQRARVRHAAITKNLYTWSNYKSWADKMRDSWDGGEPPPGAPAGSAAHPGAPKPPLKK
jgi:hypothetical protein